MSPNHSPLELVLTGGTVVDPAQGINARRDVGIRHGRIAAVWDPNGGPPADLTPQTRNVDVSGAYVVPGLIDMHVHVFPGVSHYGVDPDTTCLARGVTTVLDFGTAGSLTFNGFRRFVIDPAQTRVQALIHICGLGMLSGRETKPSLGELADLRYLDVQGLCDAVTRHRDVISGIKIRLSDYLANDGENEGPGLELAREAADATGLPLVAHTPSSSLSMEHIVSRMRSGDVLTHCFHGRKCGIVTYPASGPPKLLPAVRDALDAGLLLDVGHGWGSLSFEVARAMLEVGVLPHFISSDLHYYNVHGPVFDLLTTLDKFLHLGMPLEDVIARATSIPARFLNFAGELGTLAPGARADITVLDLQTGEFPLTDTEGVTETGRQRLELRCVFKDGRQAAQLPRPRYMDPAAISSVPSPHEEESSAR